LFCFAGCLNVDFKVANDGGNGIGFSLATKGDKWFREQAAATHPQRM